MEDIKKNFSFSVKHQNKNYRVGLIETHRGVINTPAFMPVGTQATVKGVFIDDIIKTGSEIILSNTYHLMIRPGTERIEMHGGLHKFMNCKLPILNPFNIFPLSWGRLQTKVDLFPAKGRIAKGPPGKNN